MKKNAAALALLLLCSVAACGQALKSAAAPPSEWTLSLKSGGAPWVKRFEVGLNQSGKLAVTEHDPAKSPGDPVTKLSVNLPAGDVREIYEQAWRALREFSFPDNPDEVADGTSLTLLLSANGRSLEADYHLGHIETEAPEVARLLALINKHLPEEHQVY